MSRNQGRPKNQRSVYLIVIAGLLTLFCFFSPPAFAETRPPLRVGARVISPFVMQNGGEFSGFGVDLWRSIASEMGVETRFIPYESITQVLEAIEKGQADVGIANISITVERDKKFDFSYPIFTSGLQVMVRPANQGSSMANIWKAVFSPTMRRFLVIALISVVLMAHIVWLFERQRQNAMVSRQYLPGIFEAIWWAAATLATQADQMPKGWLSRLLAVFWMFSAVVFVALFTAAVTTELTVNRLQGSIRGIDDLGGRVVATTTGSTAAEYLRSRNYRTVEFPMIEQAYDALLKQKADSVVFDAPILMYYAANDGKDRVELVGDIFRPEKYGIVMPRNSPNRRPINQTLLTLEENGTYQTLYDKYFKVQDSQ